MTERTTQQTEMLSFRVTRETKELIKREAEVENLSVGSLIKSRVLGPSAKSMRTTPRQPAADLEELRRIMGQLGKIGSNLNQIAKHLNQGYQYIDPEQLGSTQTEMTRMRKALLKALDVKWDKNNDN